MNTKETDARSALREGDSPRARFYRRKDELFSFGQEQLTAFLKELPPDGSKKISDLIVSLNKPILELKEKPEDEEVAKTAMGIVDEIEKALSEAGFKK